MAVVALGVPIDCVGTADADAAPFGCERAPAAFRDLGFPVKDVPVRLIGTQRDKGNGVKSWPAVASTTRTLRATVASVIGDRDVPLLFGGCCTLLPGALAGARDAVGALGLAYFDGHLDMYDGSTSTTGEPADMPISVISGNGPADWVRLISAPVVAPARIALVGPRDRAEAAALKSALPEDVGITAEITPAAIRSFGTEVVAAATLATVGSSFWVHLDVDVLDETEFPATDYPMPGGLLMSELSSLLAPLVSDPGLVGLSVACYNPQKDHDGMAGTALAEMINTWGLRF